MTSSNAEGRHLPALDGIRGIAILLVLLSHGFDLLGPVRMHVPGYWEDAARMIFVPGWGGVDLFFALSGFLITGILLRSRTSKTYFTAFYARRVLRIFPIYYFFLAFLLLLGALSPAVNKYLPQTLHERVSYFLYLQNWPIFWKSWAGMSGLWGAYWSLAVEEQFYLVWPTLIRWVRPRTMLAACVVGFLLGLVERGLMIHHMHLKLGILQWPFSRLDGLFLGAAIALYREEFKRVVPLKWAIAALSVGAAMYLWIAVSNPHQLEEAGVNLWRFGVTAFALMSAGLIALVEHRPPFLMRVLSFRPLLLAGRYSYGMYVYHLFIYLLLRWSWFHYGEPRFGYHPLTSLTYIALTIVIVFCVAALSFRFIETPFLRLKRFFPSPAAPV